MVGRVEDSAGGVRNFLRTYKMDMGAYIATTRSMQRMMLKEDPDTTISN